MKRLADLWFIADNNIVVKSSWYIADIKSKSSLIKSENHTQFCNIITWTGCLSDSSDFTWPCLQVRCFSRFTNTTLPFLILKCSQMGSSTWGLNEVRDGFTIGVQFLYKVLVRVLGQKGREGAWLVVQFSVLGDRPMEGLV